MLWLSGVCGNGSWPFRVLEQQSRTVSVKPGNPHRVREPFSLSEEAASDDLLGCVCLVRIQLLKA